MKYIGDNDVGLFLEFLEKNEHPMKPCSEDNIKMLTHLAKYKLPNSYLEFMRFAGNGVHFFTGSSYAMDEIHELKDWANELLQENDSPESLSDINFVFLMHQGYQFYFFNLDEGDNPPIYFYSEGENSDKFTKQFDAFSEFIISFYNDVEPFLQTSKN